MAINASHLQVHTFLRIFVLLVQSTLAQWFTALLNNFRVYVSWVCGCPRVKKNLPVTTFK